MRRIRILSALTNLRHRVVGRSITCQGTTEKGIIPKAFIKHYFSKEPIIIEAGAHVGSDTVEMSRLWPKGQIHAFEPVPGVFERLKSNTSRCRNVICYPLALSQQSGPATIFVSGGRSDASSSLLQPKQHLIEHPDVAFDTNIEIQTITLDDWAEQYRVPQVDLLWLDMQGYELAAMQAGQRVLSNVRAIYTEVNLVETYAGAPLYNEVRAWLAERGFQVAREELPWPDAGNVLFVREA